MKLPFQSRPLNCSEVRELLTLFVGADLPVAERTSVDVHLSGCLSCYRESKAQAETLEMVHCAAFQGPEMPRGEAFVADILDEIHGPPPSRAGGWLRAVAITGWAAALVLGFFLWSNDPVAMNPPSGPVDGGDGPIVVTVPANHQVKPGERGLEGISDVDRATGEEGLDEDNLSDPRNMLVHEY